MLASCCGRRHLAGHTNRRRVSACRAEPARIVVNLVTPDDRVSSSGNASAFPELRAHDFPSSETVMLPKNAPSVLSLK
jgi:hypothetical protein